MPETNDIYLYLTTPDASTLQAINCLDAAEQTLSKHAAISPEGWRFGYNAWGKPFIVNLEGVGLHTLTCHTRKTLSPASSHRLALAMKPYLGQS